jgi:hypothetical protein
VRVEGAPSVGEPCIEQVARHGVLKAGKALECSEAILLCLREGGECVRVGLEPALKIIIAIGHVRSFDDVDVRRELPILRRIVCSAREIFADVFILVI